MSDLSTKTPVAGFMPPLKIMLVDDHPIVRSGFRQLLELEPDWEVVGEVGSGQELAAWLLTSTCDVLVLDLSLPDADGLVLIRHLLVQRPDMAIVVLTMHDGALYVHDALSAGARGYVTKQSAPDELVEAIRAVARGEQFLARNVRAHVASEVDQEAKLLPGTHCTRSPGLPAARTRSFGRAGRVHDRHQRQDGLRAPQQHLRQAGPAV